MFERERSTYSVYGLLSVLRTVLTSAQHSTVLSGAAYQNLAI
jgi:hypothetical protein